jgi:carbon-monoxide dehydrogenase medium subunit
MSYPEYIAPFKLQEALEILGDTTRETRLIAGGTHLIPLLRFGVMKPDLLVDIRCLPIKQIFLQDNMLHLGAGVTCHQVGEDPLVRAHLPALIQACGELGNPSIRNRCTLGGNLAASILESNIAPALLVCDALLVIAIASGERTTPLTDFFDTNGKALLEPAELIKEILIPLPPSNTTSQFIKFGNRRGMATAIVIVAVSLSLNQEHSLSKVRIALGAYTDRPQRLENAESLLVGRSLDDAPLENLVKQALASYPARNDQFAGAEYRKKLAMVLINRVLQSSYSDLRRIGNDG